MDLGEAAWRGTILLGDEDPCTVVKRAAGRAHILAGVERITRSEADALAILAAMVEELWEGRMSQIVNRRLNKEIDKLRGQLDVERERVRERHITPAMRRQVLERDGHRCLLCGSSDDLHMDHVVPFSQGGSCHVDNLQTLCREHNLAKRATFVDLRVAVA